MNKLIKLYLRLNHFFIKDFRSKIIYYHDIHDFVEHTNMSVHVSEFIQHLDQIKSLGYALVDNISERYGQIQVCFDDGFRGVLDCRDVFIKYNFRPTIFISNQFVGNAGYLSEEEIIKYHLSPFIFQAHSVSHKNFNTLKRNQISLELKDSVSYLSSILNSEIKSFCFPYGQFNLFAVRYCLKLGLQDIYLSIPGSFKFGKIKFRILAQDLSSTDLALYLNTRFPLLQIYYFVRHFRF